MNFFRRFRDAAVCVALLALPFFFLRANVRQPSQMSALDRTLLQVSAPIQFIATKAAIGVGGVIQEYVWLVEVKRDNDRLRGENARLREQTKTQAADIAENRQLRRLLQLRDEVKGNVLTAQVIAKEISPSFFRVNRLSLDRGDPTQIRAGMPVISPDGLVGQIQRTLGGYSDVMLVADPNSAIDVVVERTGARGILRGVGSDKSYACRIEHLSREEDVQVGDRVVTSGMGQRFPAQIAVGLVKEVSKREFGLYQEAVLTPAVDFSRLREVLIMTSVPRMQLARTTGEKPAEKAR